MITEGKKILGCDTISSLSMSYDSHKSKLSEIENNGQAFLQSQKSD